MSERIRDIQHDDVDFEKALAVYLGNFESASRQLTSHGAATWLLGVAEIIELTWLRYDEGGDAAFRPDLYALAAMTVHDYQAARPLLIAELIRTLDAGVREAKRQMRQER